MNTTYQRKENKPSSSQNLKLIYPEEKKSGAINKTQENIQLREISLIPNDNYSPISTFKNDVTPINRPILKRSSFSDILAPHDLHTEVNLSLEKELERNVHKTLNTMPNKSNVFEESSIHKDQNNLPDVLSGFDIKEHDIFLNDNLMLETNNLQNKKTCTLCHNSLIIKNLNKIEESKWEEDLVYPCLCSIRAHRDCLKAYILTKKTMICERCKAVYAVSGKKRKNVKMTTGDMIIMSITILLSFGIAITGIILTAVGFGETPSKTGMGIGGIIMMVVGVMGIAYIFWRKYFSKKNVDIFVNCKQTEIARHEDDPERITKKFLDGEERKRSSTVLRKAKELLKLLDVTEFENFIKLATPRVDKDEKETIRYERRGSSNFLLPDFNPLDRDEKGKQVQKEIFISPNEFERSDITMADHKSNIMNEFSSKTKSPDLPKIRISLDLPVKDFQTTQELHPQKKLEVKQIRTFGSQSERVHSHVYQGIKNYHPKLLKLPFKEPPSALSLTNQFLTSPKENVEFPEFVMSLPE